MVMKFHSISLVRTKQQRQQTLSPIQREKSRLTVKIISFWGVTIYYLVDFTGVSDERAYTRFPPANPVLNTETVRSSEKVKFYHYALRHIPGSRILHSHVRENLISRLRSIQTRILTPYYGAEIENDITCRE
jgi:hypothetical protein